MSGEGRPPTLLAGERRTPRGPPELLVRITGCCCCCCFLLSVGVRGLWREPEGVSSVANLARRKLQGTNEAVTSTPNLWKKGDYKRTFRLKCFLDGSFILSKVIIILLLEIANLVTYTFSQMIHGYELRGILNYSRMQSLLRYGHILQVVSYITVSNH